MFMNIDAVTCTLSVQKGLVRLLFQTVMETFGRFIGIKCKASEIATLAKFI